MSSSEDGQRAAGDLTVADLAEQLWHVRPESAIERFDQPGWSYEQQVDVVCPRCASVLHTLRKPYESAGKIYRYVAIVCPRCPATFTLPDLGLKVHADLIARAPATTPAAHTPATASTAGKMRGGENPCAALQKSFLRTSRSMSVALNLMRLVR